MGEPSGNGGLKPGSQSDSCIGEINASISLHTYMSYLILQASYKEVAVSY